jgi:hypothetical protein
VGFFNEYFIPTQLKENTISHHRGVLQETLNWMISKNTSQPTEPAENSTHVVRDGNLVFNLLLENDTYLILGIWVMQKKEVAINNYMK